MEFLGHHGAAKLEFRGPPDHPYTAFEVAVGLPLKRLELREQDLVPFFQASETRTESAPPTPGPVQSNQSWNIRLICVGYDWKTDTYHISKDILLRLLEAMRADPSIYNFLQYSSGLHRTRREDVGPTTVLASPSPNMVLLWALPAMTGSDTRSFVDGIWLIVFVDPGRHDYSDHIQGSVNPYAQRLSQFADSGVASACLPALALGFRQNELANHDILCDIATPLREIEEQSGHSAWSPHELVGFNGTDQLTQASMKLGRIKTGIVMQGVHLKALDETLGFVEEVSTKRLHSSSMGQGLDLAEETQLREAVRSFDIIRQETRRLQFNLATSQQRADIQSSVIFALISHEDAVVNTALAEAAKRDSSSMKTIAVMTMVFLPATFFAALFAVPSLKWDAPTVVQDNFWVYWALTIPATVIVFALWAVVTNRSWILTKLRRLTGKTRQEDIESGEGEEDIELREVGGNLSTAGSDTDSDRRA